MKTLALCMIVKNEEKVIERCINSVKHLIDYWVIYDTGSTDETVKKIFEAVGDIPGELHHSKFVNFAHNRTEYMNQARGKADYAIVLDADEVLVDNAFDKSQLSDDCYMVGYDGDLEYYYPIIFKTTLNWRYDYVVHEVPACDSDYTQSNIDTLRIIHNHDGGCVHEKYERDIRLIREQLEQKPNDSRYRFYLANSYWDIEMWDDAIEQYVKMIGLGGWNQEVYLSMVRMALCYLNLGKTASFIGAMTAAMEYMPTRQEAYYYLGIHYCQNKNYVEAFKFLSAASKLPYPDGALFFYRPIYDYLIALWIAVAMYWLGLYQMAADINTVLLGLGCETELVKKNLDFCLEKLNQ